MVERVFAEQSLSVRVDGILGYVGQLMRNDVEAGDALQRYFKTPDSHFVFRRDAEVDAAAARYSRTRTPRSRPI